MGQVGDAFADGSLGGGGVEGLQVERGDGDFQGALAGGEEAAAGGEAADTVGG